MSSGRLVQVFERTAASCPNSLALTFLDRRLRGTSYTYDQLFAKVGEIARHLPDHLDASAPFGILLRSQEHQVLHYLAALIRGLTPAILTPPNRKLNPSYYAETTAAVLARCRFSALVTDVELDAGMPTVSLSPFTFNPMSAPAPARREPTAELARRAGASFLQFSSGTTGIKRGVLVSDEAVVAQLETYAAALQLSDDDAIASWLPLYHDMGLIACLNMPLALGVHCVMLDPIDWVTDPALFIRAASRYRATLAWNPNFAFAFMAQRVRDSDLGAVDLSSMRGLVNCSEPVTFGSQQHFLGRFRSLGLRDDAFWGCYAMAETTFALTHGTPADRHYLDRTGVSNRAGPADAPQVSVGRPLPSVELMVADASTGRRVGEHEVGEIWVRSPFNFSGYFNDQAATEQAFAPGGWYRTGDLGYFVEDSFYVPGRKKDVMIVGGVNVFPNDIEDLVSGIPGIVPGRVSAFSDFNPSLQTEQITILLEPEAAAEQELRPVLLEARQRVLAAFQVANFEVHAVHPGWLVKSSSGKTARSANRAKWHERRPSEVLA